MPGCKPGDLAFIIRADRTPEILGHIVEVVEEYAGEIVGTGFEKIWTVRYPDGRLITVTYQITYIDESCGTIDLPEKHRPHPDAWLTPIPRDKTFEKILRMFDLPMKANDNTVTTKEHEHT